MITRVKIKQLEKACRQVVRKNGKSLMVRNVNDDNKYVDENGDKANSGLIATWDRAITDKIWASVDYASGKSAYGSLSLGGSYMFAPNVSIILAYVIYNNDKINTNNQITTQLDINF